MTSPSAPKTVKHVGIWIRVSTEDQAKGESPQHHLARARAYADVKGWNVREVYDLAGVSGKSVKDLGETKRMLADIKRGHITGLIFSKLARLARNTKELLEFADRFNESHADMISLQETIDTSTPSGRLFFTMIAAMAQWEREEIADRVKASVSIRAKLGKSINGSVPYGYQWKDRKLVVHPDEAPIRRKAYELFLQHRRKGTVAKLLNAAGYRTRSGKPWHDMQVTRVLVDSSAKGIYFFNRMQKQSTSWRMVPKPESEWGKIECEPIIAESLWNQVNQLIEEQLKGWKRPGKPPKSVFGSIAHCHCGAKMYVRINYPKYLCRKCNHKIPIVDLDGIFREELKNFFGIEQQVAAHLKAAHKNLSEKETMLVAHQKEIQKVRDEMTRTHRLYLDGQVSAQGFGDFYKPAEQRLNQLTTELPKLEAEVDFLKVNNLSADEVVSEARSLYERWPTLSVEDQRKIAESIVEKIVVGEGEINITFSYLPSSEEMTKSQRQLRAG